MMFDALVDFLVANNFTVGVIDLTSEYTNIKIGKFSLIRTLEYLKIIIGSINKFIKYRGGLLYINTAQTKAGFLRDLFFVNLAWLFRYRILMQQFGSNFGNFYSELSPWFKYLVRTNFNKGHFIIVEGEFTKCQFSMLYNYQNKVVSVSNGLPERNLLITNKGKIYNPNHTFNLIYLSYMIESKGYWDVLKALNILVNTYNMNVHCVFAGSFKNSVDAVLHINELEAEEAFKLYILKNNLQNHVTYYAGLMGNAKAQAFLKANIFLLPTYFKFEGQPVSVLEAMAYGAVPVVTNYRMIPNMVTPEVGLFVDPRSPDQIAEKVLFLIKNPKTYATYSQASVDRFLEKYTLDSYSKNILNLIKMTLKEQNFE
ncbi:hypothetical protein MIZ03_2233 [Rhodoferax lithotrophicus]|uniref:Glycosyl transferase family 1 domain-containing protein n=2 Tax=Rhodoferax lithotrophicus TaxID=2798804 RepID=A0ABM7MM31_9BURK|nr:hypothetical protein MIZ03_2233 [Rhodoferax sp. MIZ03]